MLFGFNPGSNWIIGVIAIGLNYGAYLSEVVRSSIVAVAPGQTEAATALNLSSFQRMRLIIFPQAVRMMLPEFANYTIQMLKGTALVSFISLNDILYMVISCEVQVCHLRHLSIWLRLDFTLCLHYHLFICHVKQKTLPRREWLVNG